MKHIIIFVLLVISLFVDAGTESQDNRQRVNDRKMNLPPNLSIVATYSVDKYSCSFVDNTISNINSRMRAGYSAQEGEQLRDELRKVKNQRDKCKKKKHPTSE
jgi:hypothetical protein